MRYLTTLFAVTVAISCSVGAYADLDDPLYKLLPNDGVMYHSFGFSVAVSSTRVIVGAVGDNVNGEFSGSAYLFDTTTSQQLFKLLPDDGAESDSFGASVELSGTRAIIGSFTKSPDSGSAYIFDTTTGQQLFKLVPDDVEDFFGFGFSVGISGTRAIVGSFLDIGSGDFSGSAYVYDTTTGLQLFELLADDGANFDLFGESVAIDGTRAIIGAKGNDDNGNFSGSAYIFDITTGKQLFKLLPDDSAEADFFGVAVAISGTRAIIGAEGDDDNGGDSGSAYIFDVTTGKQLLKLVADDGAGSDFFGKAVAISGVTAIIGAFGDDDNGNFAGSAYLFDVTSGEQLTKLLPVDGASGDSFGRSVSISGITAIVGADGDDDNSEDAGSAYLTAVDTDGDGLLDSWEINGIDVNGDGKVDLDLPGMGADPNHKDLFVEVDSMVGLGFNATAQANVIAAFANAPNDLVDNPDELDGITLHLLVDETDIPVTPFPNTWVEFDVVKAARFGTPTERADANWPNIRSAKMKAFRYCVFGQSYGSPPFSSGVSEFPGNDFMVTLGSWPTPSGTVDQQAGTFMHEFGHALELDHGGGDDIHHKPNYYSVMNYTWQYPESGYSQHWRLDYSHLALPTLDEAHLNENNGLGAPAGMFAGVMVPFGGGDPPFITYASMQGGNAVDWDADGNSNNADTPVDINYLFSSYQNPSAGEMLVGHADWPNLSYAMFGQDFADGVHNSTTEDSEMTVEIFNELDSIPPPPLVCIGDLDGNGSVGTGDLLELFTQWGTDGPADFDGSGAVGTGDLLILLSNWGPCK